MTTTKKRKRYVALAAVIALPLAAVYAYKTLVLGSARTAEGIVIEEWSSDQLQGIPVALDVAPDGKVYIAETGQFLQGVGDNRQQSFWLLDDLASTSTQDRLAYIKKWIAAGELDEAWFTETHDTLRVLEDSDGDGRADKDTVMLETGGYLEGVMAGVLVTEDGVLVTNIPKVLRLGDTDGDLEADVIQVLSEGYGVRTAFIGHDLHGLVQGPDGKIYYSIGDRGFNIDTADGRNLQAPMDQGRGAVFRMNPDGSDLELYAWGLRNPQELAFDNYGNLVTGDNNSDGDDAARIVYVVEGGDSGWTYGYQYMEEEDYLRGPWNAERMWEPYHPGQPAWIVPPLANETNGPSGVAFYPGLGLPQRYNNHFFIANYSFVGVASWIFSFALEPDGAGFKLQDSHKFAEGDLFIDQGFGYDGKLYAITSSVFLGPKRVITFTGAEESRDPRIAEARELIVAGLDTLGNERLFELLDHPDQRMRLRAQYELAGRDAIGGLLSVATDGSASEFQRMHALWGLGQIGPQAFAGWSDFTGFEGELLAQAVKVAGEAGADNLVGPVIDAIGHDNHRVAYFAAMSAGKLGDTRALEPLVALLQRNNNQDAFLRHAAVWALVALQDRDAVNAFREHDSAAVRMGVLLAQRRTGDPRIAGFLADSDPALVVEAARAVHDLRIQEAMPALAALASTEMAINSDDPQSSYALHRRVINANLVVGKERQALALAAYAGRATNPAPMRRLALQTLKVFTRPPPLDMVWGDYLQLPEREERVVHRALDQYLPTLVDGEMGDLAMEVALAYNRMPLDDAELLAMIADANVNADQRLSALNAVGQRAASGARTTLATAISSARQSDEPALRARALELLAQQDPPQAVALALQVADSASDLRERQSAIALLGREHGADSEAYLLQGLAALEAGLLADEIQLDVVTAAQHSDSERVQAALARYAETAAALGPAAERRIARFGGDETRGKKVFENRGDCLRCHAVEGRGGIAGPDLTGIAGRFDTDYLYRALVDPGADIASGFGNVSLEFQDGRSMAGIMVNESADVIRLQQSSGHGEPQVIDVPLADVTSRDGPYSGMPAMGLVLPLHELRDVMAYLQTLN
ncbi:MAG: HEAT repeat domain-containing protein [Halioglobus sp.]|nr:HEAT repeat domain-containing protein [Halioglobus sp.]